LGVSINDDIVSELQDASKGADIVRAVRQSFYLATSISPLLALIPRKYHAHSIAYKKEALIAVSLILPNPYIYLTQFI
jgi:hypothetical protein